MTGHYPYLTGGLVHSLGTHWLQRVPTTFKFLPAYLKDLAHSSRRWKWHLGFVMKTISQQHRVWYLLGFWNGGGRHFQPFLTANPIFPTLWLHFLIFNDKMDISPFGISTLKSLQIEWMKLCRWLLVLTKPLNTPTWITMHPTPSYLCPSPRTPHAFIDILKKEYTNLYPDEQEPIRKIPRNGESIGWCAVGRIVADQRSTSHTSWRMERS